MIDLADMTVQQLHNEEHRLAALLTAKRSVQRGRNRHRDNVHRREALEAALSSVRIELAARRVRP